jgi:hypothetical protein
MHAGVFNEALKDGVSNLNFGGLSTRLGTTMYEFKFRIPPYYTLLVRSLTILEGIALSSDPNYKVLGAAYPWVARRLLTDTSTELRATLRNLLYTSDGMFRFDRMEALLEQAIKTPPPPKRPPVAMMAATDAFPAGDASGPARANDAVGFSGRGGVGYDRSSDRNDAHAHANAEGDSKQTARSSNSALVLLLSDDGEYLRGIILDELAKGLDAAMRIQVCDSAPSSKHSLLNARPPRN